MLPVTIRNARCARLTRAFARINLGGSRAFATPPATVSSEKKKPKKKPEPPVVVDKSQLPPKRPISSFSKFIMEHKDEIVREGPGALPFGQLSAKWNELSAAEKKKYAPPTEEWDRYYESFAQWKEDVDPKILKEINLRRKKKGMKPISTKKHFANSYSIFLSEVFAQKREHQTIDRTQVPIITKEAAEKWKWDVR
ncbi:hypothetical protein NMY22_g9730 [Coprinellus aureogranulatus]|nr:hypothetical protein NMY22_g9730 [Coprinellus aureogranulatus]